MSSGRPKNHREPARSLHRCRVLARCTRLTAVCAVVRSSRFCGLPCSLLLLLCALLCAYLIHSPS